MIAKQKIIALCGSTRANSTNHRFVQAISDLSADYFDIHFFKETDQLPHFNPDLDNENAPEIIRAFRQTLRAANGILICTPEYAMGVPGTLKNAIDWTVSSMEFSQKPLALITASSLGQKAHASLLETLKVIEAKMTEETQLLISFAQTKINQNNEITDPATLNQCMKLLRSFNKIIESQ